MGDGQQIAIDFHPFVKTEAFQVENVKIGAIVQSHKTCK
jgi:hypothetical protein